MGRSGAHILIVGGGARSHALGELLRRSPSVERVVFAPGTTGLEHLGYETAPVASQDLRGLAEHAMMEAYDLTVVGPNTPLVDGIVDIFEAEALPIFGPNRAAARLEGSKVFGRSLMRSLGVPTPKVAIADTADRAKMMARSYPWARVFKADGIAYDKGVRVTYRASEADDAIDEVMRDNIYGLESERVVIEQRIDGREVTVFCMTDGEEIEVLGHVLNHPRLLNGEGGPPTRGMGQVAPAPIVDEALLDLIRRVVLEPTIAAMAEQKTPLRGALFVDLMLVGRDPYVIDYNVRFGDPATQTLLSAYEGDFYAVLQACRETGRLREAIGGLRRDPRPRVSLVVVCEGYPTRFVRGARIELDPARFDDPDVDLFWDGVRATPEGIWTTGGRTFSVVAAAPTVAGAREKAYAAVRGIRFEGMHYRTDIGSAAG